MVIVLVWKQNHLVTGHDLYLTLVMPAGVFPLAAQAADPENAEELKAKAMLADKRLTRKDRVF